MPTDAAPPRGDPVPLLLIPVHEHGSSPYWYSYYRCPHELCVKIASETRSDRRRRHRANRVKIWYGDGVKDWYWFNQDVPIHGTSNGYRGYGCTCLIAPREDGAPVTDLTPHPGDRPGCGPAGRGHAAA